MRDAIIIGGGAAGLAAAVTAVGNGRDIAVMDAADRVGKKLLLAGNGRCNLSNAEISAKFYNDPDIERFLGRSGLVSDFFRSLGLKTRTIDGRIYPYTESGNTVLNLMRKKIPTENILTGVVAREIVPISGGFSVGSEAAKKIILSTGSAATVGRGSYDLLKKFGHTVREIQPILVPLKCDGDSIKGLSGLRAKIAMTVKNGDVSHTEYGEVLFKDGILSGIVTLDVSRSVIPGKSEVFLDFVPEMSEEESKKFLSAYGAEGLVHRLIAAAIERQAKKTGRDVSHVIKNFSVGKVSPEPLSRAQAARGGIPLSEFDDNLQSRKREGIFAAGEVIDIDGACGGYNLHWAFLSGIITGGMV